MKTKPSLIQRVRAIVEDDRANPDEQASARALLARLMARQAAEKADGGEGYWSAYARWYGDKYHETSHMSLTEIAKRIRGEISLARKLARQKAAPGAVKVVDPIGDAPKEIKISVRTEYFSGGGSIDVYLKGIPEDWWETVVDRWGCERPVPTERLRALADELRRVVQAYNYDGSDPQTDYFDKRFFSAVMTAEGTHLA